MLVVDLGVMLDGRVGRLLNKPILVKDFADYYVVPGEIVRDWVRVGRRVNARGSHIYMYKYPLRAGTKEEQCQTRELAKWLNRFDRSEEHTSELQSLMRNSYAVFCLKKKKKIKKN